MARPFGTRKYESVKELQSVIDEYFDFCDENNRPYTISGLAYALGIDRTTLYNYSKDSNYFNTIKKAKELVEMQLEENLYRLGNNSGIIFNLKNNFGWKDQQEIDVNKQEISKLDELLKEIKGNADE